MQCSDKIKLLAFSVHEQEKAVNRFPSVGGSIFEGVLSGVEPWLATDAYFK